MKRALILASEPRKPSPLEAEWDRLIDLRARRVITLSAYLSDRDALLARMNAEARV